MRDIKQVVQQSLGPSAVAEHVKLFQYEQHTLATSVGSTL